MKTWKEKTFLPLTLGIAGIKRWHLMTVYPCEYQIPNAISLFDEEFLRSRMMMMMLFWKKILIVEVKSHASIDKREIYYIGKGCTKQRDVSLTAFNNQKVDEDRTYIFLFGLAAFHAVRLNPEETEIHYILIN